MRGTSLDPTTSHSIWNINNWTGGGGGGGNEAADTEAEYQAWLRAERKKAREGIDKTFAPYGLDDNAFAYGDPIRRKYQKFVMDAPITGIKAQRRTAGADLAAALERQGLGKSATAAKKDAEMGKTFAKAQVDAALQGDQKAMAVRNALMKAKQAALDNIALSSDPASAVSTAMTSADIATDPGQFEPMYDVFDKITQGLLLRQEVENRKKQREFFEQYFPPSSSAKYHP
tara:strand:- start:520 stop:1209 length:690 start_codon:yes stop_codon:yes gene_type:complete